MKKLIIAITLIFCCSSIVHAQEESKNDFGAKLKDSNFHLGLGLDSKYLWRGIENTSSICLYPTVSYENKGLQVYATGCYGLDGDYQEVDLGVNYTVAGLNIAVNDYYYPTACGQKDDFYNFKGKETGHWVEGCLRYEHDKVPVWALVSTFVAGADKNPDTDKQACSSYAEIGTHYDFLNDNSVSLALGAALNKSLYNNYEKGFCICNVDLAYTYNVNFKNNWSLPLTAHLITNPANQKTFVVFGTSFGF